MESLSGSYCTESLSGSYCILSTGGATAKAVVGSSPVQKKINSKFYIMRPNFFGTSPGEITSAHVHFQDVEKEIHEQT